VAEIDLMSSLEYEYWKVYFKLDAEETEKRIKEGGKKAHNEDIDD
jgi:hypothetical protein